MTPQSNPRRLAVWAVVVCLALTLILLGAAAKHSQFESPGHGTAYLTQSVKMVEGHQMDAPTLTEAVEGEYPAGPTSCGTGGSLPVRAGTPKMPGTPTIPLPLLI